jgi:hypothetical protein
MSGSLAAAGVAASCEGFATTCCRSGSWLAGEKGRGSGRALRRVAAAGLDVGQLVDCREVVRRAPENALELLPGVFELIDGDHRTPALPVRRFARGGW